MIVATFALGCSDPVSSAPAGVELKTDTSQYPAAIPSVMQLTVTNATGEAIAISMCTPLPVNGQSFAPVPNLVYERHQPDGTWTRAPYFTCTTPPDVQYLIPHGAPVVITRDVVAAPQPGEYRVKLGWKHPTDAVIDTVVSNAYSRPQS
jgi:hypothetical protein